MVLLKVLKTIFFGTYARGFITSYLLFMFIGASLLILPISVQSGVTLSFVDAVFTSASALSTTGLSTIVVKDTFTLFGQTVLILIIQFGGIGLIMMVALFWLIVRSKIGFKQRNMIMTDQNQLSRQGIVRFVRDVLIVILTIEVVAFVVMTIYLTASGYFVFSEAAFQAFFTTISLFTNAGFDIAPNADSFQMYANDYFMQSLAMFLMFMGAVGFWFLAEVKEYIIAKINKESFTFSWFVKTLFVMHLGIWIISALLVFTLERNGFLAGKGFFETVYYTLFMSLTTRNAGFSTMDVSEFTGSTQIFFIFLMFLGSSPNSAGGGIRTTTFLVILLTLRSFAGGRDRVVFQKRFLKEETVMKALLAVLLAIMIVAFNLLILTIVEPHEILHLMFEIVSAFGTTGLSLGVTDSLTLLGRLVLIVTMFIGRVGVLALLLMFRSTTNKSAGIQYPETDMIVG